MRLERNRSRKRRSVDRIEDEDDRNLLVRRYPKDLQRRTRREKEGKVRESGLECMRFLSMKYKYHLNSPKLTGFPSTMTFAE